MSTTVEKRVLDMQLKNSEFERNAKQTLSTIQELKNSLNFTGVGKGFDEISKSANSVKFDQLISSVGQIESKFSLLNTAVRNIFSDMVAKAVNTGSQILSAFTIEPITSGFNEYEAKIGSVQTILANTASRQKEVSQEAIQSINDEATAAVAKSKELNEEAIDNLQESQAAQDRALSKSFENQNKAYEKQAQAQTKAFEKQASKRLEGFEKETEKEVDALEKSYDQKYKALETEEDQELDLQQKNYEAKNKALEKAQKAELTTLEKAYKEQTKAYEKEMKNQLKALEDRFDSETEALEDSIDEQIDILEDQHEEELEVLEEANEAEIEAIESKYDDEIEAAEEAAEAELEIFEQKYDDQLDALEESSDDQLEALEDYYDDAYDALEKSQEAEQELLERNHDAKLDMYEEEYMAKLKASDEERYNKIKAIDNQINSIKNLEKAEKAESEAAEKRQKLQELTQAVEQAETYTERMRAEQKLSDYKKKIAQEQRQQERDAQIDALEAQKDAVNEEYDLRAQQYKEEYDLRKESENDLYKTEKQNMSDLHKDQKEALKEQEQEEKKTLQKQIADQKEIVKEQYEYEKKLLEERKKDQTEALKEQRDAEKEAAKERQEDNKEALKDRQEDEEEALKKQTDAQKKALKDQQELEKDALKEQQDAQKEAMAETYQIHKEALEERQKQQSEALKDQNAAEKKALQESFDERKAKLDEQKDAELAALTEKRNKEKEDLNEKIEAERTALNDRIDAERSAIKDSQDAQKAALDSRQKAELKAMKARHKQELANIESEKNARIAALNASAGKTEASSLEEVNAALDELNDYADKTIYNFEDMTRNIGTFTAAGVGLEDSVTAIKGIANLAALSGSNATQASTAMYQLSQAISTGTLRLEDWRSVENAGMGGAQFRESLKETARAHGIAVDEMIAKEGSFRNSLQHGWLTSEVLLETLSKFTGDLTDEQLKSMGYTEDQIDGIQAVAQNAVDAATKVRTWSQLIDTTKEALGSGWAETFEIIFGNFDEATNLWTEVSNVISEVIDKQADARNQLLTGWKDSGGRKDLIDAVKNVFNGVQEILKPVQEAFTNIFPPLTVQNLIDFTNKLKELTSHFKLSDEATKNLKKTFEGLFSGVKIVGQAFGAFFKALSPVWDIVKKVAGKVLEFTGDLGKLIAKVSKASDELGLFDKISGSIKTALETLFGAVGGFVGPVIDKIDEFRKKIVDAFSDAIAKSGKLEGPFGEVIKIFDSVKTKAGELFTAITGYVTQKFGTIDTTFLTSFAGTWSDIIFKIKTEYGGILGILQSFAEKVKEYAGKAGAGITDLGKVLSDFGKSPVATIKTALKNLLDWFSSIPKKLEPMKDGIGELIKSLLNFGTEKFKAPDLSSIFDFFDTLTGKKIDTDKTVEAANKAAETVAASFDNGKLSALKENVQKFAGFIKDAIDFVNEKINFNGIINNLGKATALLAGYGISSILTSFGKLEKSLAKVVKGFKGVGKSVTKVVGEFQNTVKSFTGLIDGVKGNLNSLTTALSGTIESFKSVPKSISGMFDQLKDSIGKIGQTRKIDKIQEIAKLILVLGVSIKLLAESVKIFSDIDTDTLTVSIMGVSSLIIALGGTSLLLSQYGGEAKVNATSILSLAIAVNIVAKAVQKIGEMGTEDAIQGGIGALGALAGLTAATKWIGESGIKSSQGVALLEMAGALLIMQKAVEKFAELDPNQFIVGGALVAGALYAMSKAAGTISDGFNTSAGVGLIGMATALVIMSKALEEFGKLHVLTEIIPGLLAMGGALAELVIALNNMKGTTQGAVALGILATSMIPLAKAFSMMSQLSFGQIITGLIGFGGALTALLVASALIAPFSSGIIALSAGLAAFGLVVLGIGAGLTALVVAISTLATVSAAGLGAVIEAFGVLATGILNVLIGLTPKVAEFISSLIEAMCTVMMAKKQFMFETGFNLLLAVLDLLAEHGAELVDKLAQVIFIILDGLKLYGPDIVEKAVELAVSLFSTIIDTLNKQNPDTLIHAVEAFAGISILMVVCAGLSKLAVPAMKGLGELGVFVVELIAIVSLIGGLGQIPGFTWLIGEGGKVLEAVGLAIGGFFGGIVGGVVKGATSVLPDVGTQISQFMENADYFLKNISKVGDDQKKGAKNLASIITSLTGASLLDSIVNIISEGGQRYSRLGSELSSFAETAQPFFDSMKDLGVSGGIAMVGVNAIASAVMTLTKQKILDGITSFITGGSSLKSFGEELKAFGPSVKEYAKETEGIDGKAVEGSANAIKILAKAAKALPNDGGVIAYWTGDNSLEDFGAQLKAFGPNLKAYANEVKDIDSDSVEGSANAIKVLSRAAKVIPNSGGKIASWLGDNKLDDFGAQLVSFGPDLADYADSVKDISEKKVKASARAAEALAGLANNLPETGGFLQAFLGEQSLEDFGDDLEAFGTSLASYSDTIKNIGEGAIASSAAAAATLVALANDLPEEKGLFGKLFGGEQSLETFGKNLKAFGGYMVEYYNNVKQIPTTNNLYGIGLIASKMIDVALDIQNIDVKDLKSLGENMEKLGEGENGYYDEVSDIDFDKVSKSITQINRLVSLADVLKDFNSDLFTSFGSAMKSLADAGIDDFADAFDEAYDDCVEAINKFVAAMSKGVLDKKEDMSSAGQELGAEIPSGLVTGMGSKGREINDQILLITGAMVTAFSTNLPVETFNGIGSAATNAIKNGFSEPGSEVLSTITTLTGGIVSQFANGLKESTFSGYGRDNILGGLADGMSNSVGQLNITKAVQLVCSMIKTEFNRNLTYDQMKNIAVVAINGLIYGFGLGQYNLNTAVQKVASGWVTTIGNNMTYYQGENIGVNFINGLIFGITNGSYYVNNAMLTVANSAIRTMNNAWQIHSPSRITYEAGELIDEGLANGVHDNEAVILDEFDRIPGDVQNVLDDYSFEIGSGTSVSSDVADSIEDLGTGYMDLDTDMSQYFEDGIDLSTEATDIIGENSEDIQKSLGLNNESMNELSTNTSTFSTTMSSSTTQVDLFKNAISSASQKISEITTYIQRLTTQISEFIKKIETATSDLNKFNTEVKENKTNLGKLSTKLSKLVKEFSPLKKMVEKITKTFDKMETSISKASNSLGSFDDKYSNSGYSTGTTSANATDFSDYSSYTPSTDYSDFGDLSDYLDSNSYGYSSDLSDPDKLSSFASDIGDEITDEMRKRPPDLTLDLSNGTVLTSASNDTGELTIVEDKTAKKTTKKSTSTIGTTSGIKALAASMDFGTTSLMASVVNDEVKQTQKALEIQNAKTDNIEYTLEKLLGTQSAGNTTNIENNNVFHINSTDPKQSATEVGRILQKQVERSKAVWAS